MGQMPSVSSIARVTRINMTVISITIESSNGKNRLRSKNTMNRIGSKNNHNCRINKC